MNSQPLRKLTLTPKGIMLDGECLNNTSFEQLTERSQRYIARANDLLKRVHPEDWDSHIPHDINNVPTLAKAHMMLALADPILLDKYSPDQPRDWHGRWTNSSSEAISAPHHQTEYRVADSGQIKNDVNTSPLIVKNPVKLDDGTTVDDPTTGKPILMPSNVSLSANIEFGENIKDSSWIRKDAAMFEAFKTNGTMDYQRISSSLRDSKGEVLIDRDYINFGNFNYGVVASAAGYPLDDALAYAAKLNRYHALTNRNINTSGKHHGNVRNEYYIRMGYSAYTSGKIKGAQ